MRYLLIKDHTLTVKETEDFLSLLKEELGEYDSCDWLFDEDPDIRAFVRDLSIYDQKETLRFYCLGELSQIYCGTVIFAKTGKYSFRSLSLEDISLLQRKLSYNEHRKRYEVFI